MEVSQEEEDFVPLVSQLAAEIEDGDQRVVTPDIFLSLHEFQEMLGLFKL